MLLGILVSVSGTALVLSHLGIWSFLVVGTLSTCGWLKPKVGSEALVLYFVVSAIGSLLFLVSSCASPLSSLVLQFSLLLKLGMSPFQFWVYKVLCPLELSSLCFFLGPLKVGLLWLLVNIQFPSLVLSSMSLFIGIILL